MKPRVHPNGFIQLDLANNTRLHVWPDGDDIPRQTTVNTIHDHKFDMTSTVLCGELTQVRYDIAYVGERDAAYEIYKARYYNNAGRTRDTILYPTGNFVNVHGYESVVGAGESYTQPRLTFHDTQWKGLTATLMHKSNVLERWEPSVLCPIGQPPDNDYDRWEADPAVVWSYINRAMHLAFPFLHEDWH